MTDEKVLELTDLYESELEKLGTATGAKRAPTGVYIEALEPGQVTDHLIWCCHVIRKYVTGKQHDLAVLWLGFVQGCLFHKSVFSIEEMRRQVMEGGADPDPIPSAFET